MNQSSSRRWLVPLVFIFLMQAVGGEVTPGVAASDVAALRKVSGTATIAREGQTIPAIIGLGIRENDTLRTGPDGCMGILFNDDTLLSLGPDSALVIDQYVFAPRQGKFSIVLKMLKGTAAYLSGLISRLAPESAHFETPTASIGIRGTNFVVKVEGKGNEANLP